jgi:DNA-binding NtrC family response regulator
MTEQRTILVVDDDSELRQGLRAMLHQHGYRTLAAGDGQKAKELIADSSPDLVILDIMMPREGGFAVLKHFHGRADAPPFIMITANDQDRYQAAAQKAGVVDYIAKPFSMARLLHGVTRALGESPRQSQSAATKSPFIRCRCPGCGARIRAAVELLGKMRICPGCQQPMIVQAIPPEDERPKLAMDAGQPQIRRAPARWMRRS